jgi:hypothetical protein
MLCNIKVSVQTMTAFGLSKERKVKKTIEGFDTLYIQITMNYITSDILLFFPPQAVYHRARRAQIPLTINN